MEKIENKIKALGRLRSNPLNPKFQVNHHNSVNVFTRHNTNLTSSQQASSSIGRKRSILVDAKRIQEFGDQNIQGKVAKVPRQESEGLYGRTASVLNDKRKVAVEFYWSYLALKNPPVGIDLYNSYYAEYNRDVMNLLRLELTAIDALNQVFINKNTIPSELDMDMSDEQMVGSIVFPEVYPQPNKLSDITAQGTIMEKLGAKPDMTVNSMLNVVKSMSTQKRSTEVSGITDQDSKLSYLGCDFRKIIISNARANPHKTGYDDIENCCKFIVLHVRARKQFCTELLSMVEKSLYLGNSMVEVDKGGGPFANILNIALTQVGRLQMVDPYFCPTLVTGRLEFVTEAYGEWSFNRIKTVGGPCAFRGTYKTIKYAIIVSGSGRGSTIMMLHLLSQGLSVSAETRREFLFDILYWLKHNSVIHRNIDRAKPRDNAWKLFLNNSSKIIEETFGPLISRCRTGLNLHCEKGLRETLHRVTFSNWEGPEAKIAPARIGREPCIEYTNSRREDSSLYLELEQFPAMSKPLSLMITNPMEEIVKELMKEIAKFYNEQMMNFNFSMYKLELEKPMTFNAIRKRIEEFRGTLKPILKVSSSVVATAKDFVGTFIGDKVCCFMISLLYRSGMNRDKKERKNEFLLMGKHGSLFAGCHYLETKDDKIFVCGKDIAEDIIGARTMRMATDEDTDLPLTDIEDPMIEPHRETTYFGDIVVERHIGLNLSKAELALKTADIMPTSSNVYSTSDEVILESSLNTLGDIDIDDSLLMENLLKEAGIGDFDEDDDSSFI